MIENGGQPLYAEHCCAEQLTQKARVARVRYYKKAIFCFEHLK